MGAREVNNWYYRNTQIEDIPRDKKDSIGFIYVIYFTTGEYYYGQKSLELSKKQIVAESTAIKEGKSNFRKYKSKSGKNKGQWIYYRDKYDTDSWKEYCSSSDIVKKMISNGVGYKKEVLLFVKKKGQLNWEETKKIICSGCMEDGMCLNLRVGNYHKVNIMKYKNDR